MGPEAESKKAVHWMGGEDRRGCLYLGWEPGESSEGWSRPPPQHSCQAGVEVTLTTIS